MNGAAFVYVGTGSALALELLGYTEAGVNMDIKENKAEIMTDLMGSMTPQDFQDMGMIANLETPLIALDSYVLSKVMGRGDHTAQSSPTLGGGTGLTNTPGLVLGAGGFAFPVVIASPYNPGTANIFAGNAWRFETCLCMNSDWRLATKANPFKLQLLAWPLKLFTATSGKDALLWSRVVKLF